MADVEEISTNKGIMKPIVMDVSFEAVKISQTGKYRKLTCN